jgi:hypothetical protein
MLFFISLVFALIVLISSGIGNEKIANRKYLMK